MKEILVIQCARMGDLIQSLPAIKGLRATHAPCRISLVYDVRWRELAQSFPEVDAHYPLDVRAFWGSPEEQLLDADRFRETVRWLGPLRNQRFDLVCNLNHAFSAAILASLVPAGARAGFHFDPVARKIIHTGWFTYLVALTRDRRLNGFNLSELFLRGAGVLPSRSTLFAPREASVPGGLIGIQIGASDARKRWPDASFSRLIDLAAARLGLHTMLLGARNEGSIAERILYGVRDKSKIRLNLETPAGRLPEVLADLDLLITPDTGPMHMAAWCGVPVLALFTGSSFFVETSPWTENAVILQSWTPLNPCADGRPCCTNQACQQALTPEWVCDVLEHQLRLARSREPFSALVDVCTPPPNALLAVPRWEGNSLSYACRGGADTGTERNLFKAFWISLLGPRGDETLRAVREEPAGAETLQTAQLLFASLASLDGGAAPPERPPRVRRALTDLRAQFPEFALMFEYYGLQLEQARPPAGIAVAP